MLNGSAAQNNCHCYTLTPDQLWSSGSIWNKNKIDLTLPFDYYFNVFLGCEDENGADGIVFVLQPVSTSLGSAGEGMGFSGISPSLGVSIDTWQNFNQSDPPMDHIALQANGDVNHSSTNNLAGPVSVLVASSNIEDCNWHVLRINWQPSDNTIQVSMDGVERFTVQQDFINTIFNGDPLVYWGFTSATGGAKNLQQMCTSLDAKFVLPEGQTTCFGTPITFIDSSVSFGSIEEWYWDFDDGTTSNLQFQPPHVYAKPGIYDVTLNILGNDGCLSDTFHKEIIVGTYPIADFTLAPTPVCTASDVLFTDSTRLEFGTENYWYWNLGNGNISNEQNPPTQTYSEGNYIVSLFVESKEGCASDTVTKMFTVSQSPAIDFTSNDACKNSPVLLTAQNINSSVPVQKWMWSLADGNTSTDSSFTHSYNSGGLYNVSLVGIAQNGCPSDTIMKPVNIYATNAFAGNDTTILLDYPYQLHATGGDQYTWSPSINLSDPFIADPIVTLGADATYAVTATTTVLGCPTTDSIHLKVVKGPEIYVPTAFTPNGDGRNDVFHVVPAGISSDLSVVIANRWGQIIYSFHNASDGWDGTFKGIAQPAGTYIWMVAGKTIEGTLIKKQGTVVLIR